MGYGEYSGGGSVNWRVIHDTSAPTTPAHEERDGRPGKAGEFRIFVDGQQVGDAIPFKPGTRPQIRIVWTPDTPATAEADSAKRPWTGYIAGV